VASLSLSVNSSKTVYGEMDQVAAISQFNSADPCADEPQIKIVKPASGASNLANVASQTKPEGIIFPGKYIDPKKKHRENSEGGRQCIATIRQSPYYTTQWTLGEVCWDRSQRG